MGTVEPVAIIGMAGRFPASADLDEFWENVFGGRDCLTELTEEELLRYEESPRRLADPNYVRRRPVLADADAFDARVFGMTPREAELRDPQYRLMLETTHEALSHAGYDPTSYPRQIGLFAGTNVNRYRYDYIEERPDVLKSVGYLAVDIANSPDYLSTFVSYKLGLRGPSMTVLTACSTSLVAIHLACNAIRAGDCDMAVAGGVDLEFPFNLGYIYQPGGIVARDGVPRALDRNATGTNFGNGVGVVLLKPLAAALADRDTVYAVVLGSAINNDGNRKVGFTAPSVAGQSECIQSALCTAEVDPRTISYVEAHGTATPVGDPIELAGLIDAFRTAGGPDLPTGYCALGSVKSNIGHLGQAAGVAGLIKTVLALHHRWIPATINVTEPNPGIDWDDSPFHVATEGRDWPAGETPRRASVSSFGIGGTNAHVVLEEAPPVAVPPPASRPSEPVLWSAATESAAELSRGRLAKHFATLPGDRFADAAYTLRTGRIRRAYRGAVLATDASDAAEALRDPRRVLRPDGTARSVVFAFPGQGAQRPGILGDLYDSEPNFRQGCDVAFEVLAPLLDLDLRHLARNGDAEELAETVVAQPLLYVVSFTLAHLLMRWGVEPDAMLGHSLGELVAGATAGVFDFEDGLRAVAARARLMQEMPRGRMLVVNAAHAAVGDHVLESVTVAAVNGPLQVVLSGPADSIEEAAEALAVRGFPTKILNTSHAYHSPMMNDAAKRFEETLASMTLRAPNLPIVSAATGAEISEAEATSPAFWARQLVEPVLFDTAAQTVLAGRSRTVVEVGPGRTLDVLLRARADTRAARSRILPTLGSAAESSAGVLQDTLTRLWVDGESVSYWAQEEPARGYRRVAVPGYPYERQRYWIDPLPQEPDQKTAPAGEAAAAPAPTVAARTANSGGPATGPVSVRSAAEADAAARDDVVAPAPGFSPDWSLSELVWRREREGRTPGATAHPPGGTALVLEAHPAGTGRPDVRGALQRAGYRTLPVDPRVDPGSADSWTAWLDQLVQAGTTVDVVAHCTLLHCPPTVAAEDIDAQLDDGFHSLMATARAVAMLQRRQRRPVTLVVIGRYLADVTGGDPLNPATAMAPALLRSAEREITGLRTVCVDVGTSTPEATLSRELADLTQPLVALRGAARWLPYLQLLPRTGYDDDAGSQTRLRYRGTYLVTGGLGGIGLVTARTLADSGLRPRLGLIGRSALPAADTAAGRRLRAELDEILAAGAEVETVAADVTDVRSLRAAVEVIEHRFGPINGVVHSAGVPGGGLVERREHAETLAVLAPKTRGILALDAVFDRHDLDFLVLYSSQAGLAGLFGSADYAAANAFVDAYARSAAGRERWTISVQWPGWSQVGMAARSDVSLTTLTGVAGTTAGRDPEVPALTRTYAPGESWEFDEHVFDGQPVLPGTAFLELALLAAPAAGCPAGTPVEVRDAVFLAPVVGDGPVELRVLVTPVAGVHRFRLQTRPAGGDRSWVDNANGTIAPAQAEPAPVLAELRRRLERGKDAGLADWIEFGERWNLVREVRAGDNERLARLVLAEKYAGDFAEHPLHPAIIDVATGVLTDIEPGKQYAPFLYRRVLMLAPLTADVTVHAWFTDNSSRRPRPVNIDFYDTATDDLLVRVEAFTLREVRPHSFHTTSRQPAQRTSSWPAPEPGTAPMDVASQPDPMRPGLLAPDDGSAVLRILLAGAFPAVVNVDAPGALLEVPGIPRREDNQGPSRPLGSAQPTVDAPFRHTHPTPAASPGAATPPFSRAQSASTAAPEPAPGVGTATGASREGEARDALEPDSDAGIGQDPILATLCAIWTDALGLAEIAPDDDFFDLGGNSLTAVQVIGRIKERYGVQLSAGALFELTTVRMIADEVRRTAGTPT
ncbi:SDR family NAD(P)-dependent oxidoreductase [Micromonospora lupini]|uniref:type I polyketide synthase n=1 Tax=Micromonospora lupini TaxID=285679 RepID=UPI00340B7080